MKLTQKMALKISPGRRGKTTPKGTEWRRGISHRRKRYNVCPQGCCDTWTVTRVRHHLFLLKDDQTLRNNCVGKGNWVWPPPRTPPPPRKSLLRVCCRLISALMCGVSCDIGRYLCLSYCLSLSVPVYLLVREKRAKSHTLTFWGTNMIICSTVDTSVPRGVPVMGGALVPSASRSPEVFFPEAHRAPHGPHPPRGFHPYSCLVSVSFFMAAVKFLFWVCYMVCSWGFLGMEILALQN